MLADAVNSKSGSSGSGKSKDPSILVQEVARLIEDTAFRLFFNFDGLVLVVQVGVNRDLYTFLIQVLEHDNFFAYKSSGIKSELKLHCAVWLIRREFHRGSDLLVIYHERLSCFLVHQDTLHLIFLSRNEVGVLYSIYDHSILTWLQGTITVCIGNYGYYNEGELRDRWITLPKTDAEIQQFLTDNGLQDAQHEEIYISDYDGIPFGFNYGTIFSEYTDLDDLNLLAKQMELRPDAVERVQEVLDTGCDAPENIIELMNLVEQADEIPFYSYEYSYMFNKDSWGQTCLERMSNEENYGYTLLEGTPLMELLEQNSEAMSAFDVGEYGRQCAENSYVSLSDHGYLDNSQDMPDLDYYCREELVEMIAGEWDKEHESDVSQEQGYSLSSEQRDMSKAKDALANEGRDMEQMRATDAR